MAFGPSVVAPQIAHDADRRAQEELTRQAKWFATDAERRLQDSGFSCDGAVGVAHPGQELLKETENRGAHLVVVGSRGLGPVRRTLLGSVGDHVVRNAPAALVARRGPIVHT